MKRLALKNAFKKIWQHTRQSAKCAKQNSTVLRFAIVHATICLVFRA